MRVPQTKSKLEQLRARKNKPEVVEFQAVPGTRLLAAAMCGIIALFFVIHQTQVEGLKPLIRATSSMVTRPSPLTARPASLRRL